VIFTITILVLIGSCIFGSYVAAGICRSWIDPRRVGLAVGKACIELGLPP
jgi:hypothetical protein